MATLQDIQLERIRRERERRAGGTAAPAARPSFRDATIQGGRQSENVTDLSTNQAGLEVKEGDPLLAPSPLPTGAELRSLPQVIDDLMLQFGEGYTYNQGNWMSGGTEADVNAARDRTGWAGTAAEFGGALTSPSLAARVPAMAFKGGKTLAHGVGGALESGLSAYGQGKDWGEIGSEALKGGGVTGAISKVSGPAIAWLDRLKNKRNQTYKTNEDLTRGRKEQYAKVDSSGAVFRNSDLRQLDAMLANLPMTPGTKEYETAQAIIKKFRTEYAGKNIAPSDLDKLRRRVGIVMSGDKPSKALGGEMVGVMDKFSKNTPLHTEVIDPATGRKSYQPAPSVDADLKKARDLNAREERLKVSVDTERAAQRLHRTGRFNPFGASLESARVKAYGGLNKKIEAGKTKTSPFTPEERKAVTGLEEGTFKRNLGGAAEHLAPSGSLIGKASMAAPFVTSLFSPVGAIGAIVPGAAEIAHRVGQHATNKEIEDLQALIRDPTGKGIKVDPAKIDEARKRLAQLTSKAYRSGALPGDQER